ncbi:hypothetical protein AS29_004105 [Bacillus sp. SJS]|nr:hypothetical protein AS29_004105 [Bacillus sp. SJS]
MPGKNARETGKRVRCQARMPGKPENGCDARQECQANTEQGLDARQECRANGKTGVMPGKNARQTGNQVRCQANKIIHLSPP